MHEKRLVSTFNGAAFHTLYNSFNKTNLRRLLQLYSDIGTVYRCAL